MDFRVGDISETLTVEELYADAKRAADAGHENLARTLRQAARARQSAPTTAARYPAWTATHANEEFDRAQALAAHLTEEDRAAGRPAPAYGYSADRFEEAERIVREANRYHPKHRG